MKKKKSYPTLTDLFCGCGGSTLGAVRAGLTIVQAANHWKLACETYAANHNVDPDCADISNTSPRRYASTDVLIASPECTNHSLAKGKPRVYYTQDLFGTKLIDESEERSRATMWDVPRFAEYHDYNLVVTENVVDAGRWRMFDAWLLAMHSLGYEHKVVYFNSMFALPTPQSRDRMYVVFWKKGNKQPDLEFRPRAFCPRCGHDVDAMQFWKSRQEWGRYGDQYFYVCPFHHPQNIKRGQTKSEWQKEWSITPYYYAGFNAIDWTVPTLRIGDREAAGKKALAPKTLERVEYGLKLWGEQMMIVSPRYGTGKKSRVHNANFSAIPTQPGDASHAVVMPWIVDVSHTKANGSLTYSSLDALPTQTTTHALGIVAPAFMDRTYTATGPNRGLFGAMTDPIGTMVASGSHHALVQTDAFLSYYYGTSQASMLSEPVRTIRGKEHAAIVQGAKAPTVDDLYYRMMTVQEIGKTMAFPDDYIVLGDSKSKVKQFGNAVTPPVMDMIVERCIPTLL